jgi:hypothetical protein
MKTIREYDASNNLVAAGYEWGEPDDRRLILFLGLAAGSLGLAVLGIDLVTKSWAAVPALCGAAAAAWASYEVYKRRRRTRSLIFRCDGSIDAPHRLPDFLWPRYQVGGHHEHIASIGQLVDHEPGGKRQNRTALYAKNGNIVRVTGDVHPDIAHRVAVQLSAALQDIRDTMAWSAAKMQVDDRSMPQTEREPRVAPLPPVLLEGEVRRVGVEGFDAAVAIPDHRLAVEVEQIVRSDDGVLDRGLECVGGDRPRRGRDGVPSRPDASGAAHCAPS